MLALLAVPVPKATPALVEPARETPYFTTPFTPTADAGFGAGGGDRAPFAAGSFFLGIEHAQRLEPTGVAPFLAGGVSAHIAEVDAPYTWTIGPELRSGLASFRRPQHRVPDVDAYLSLSPFYGTGAPRVRTADGWVPGPSVRHEGVRVGLGVTAPAMTRWGARTVLDAPTHGDGQGAACEFLTNFAGFMLTAVNHAEVGYEIDDAIGQPGAPDRRVYVRVGSGF